MTTSTSTSTPAPPAPAAAAGRRRALLIAVGVVGGLVLLFLLALFALQGARAGALPGTRVGGADVGGLAGDDLREAVTAERDRRAAEAVAVTGGPRRVEATAGDLGYDLDVDATVEAVLARGRQLNPVAAMGDHLRAFGGETVVPPVEIVDDGALNAFVDRVSGELEVAPIEGELRFDGATVVRTDPAPGQRADAQALAEQARAAVLAPGPDELAVATVEVPPVTDAASLDQAEQQARAAVSGPVELTSDGAALTLQPDQIARVLRVDRSPEGTFALAADPALLREVAGDQVAALETAPVDASFVVEGGAVRIVDGRPGVAFDPDAAAEQVLELATGDGPRSAPLEGEAVTEPDRTLAEAEALRITEQVSTFTTIHPGGEPRVQNIHRMADLLDGVVIEPGETFSINEFVGERTVAKGFVDAPAIQDGEFVPSVGGGVSQFATTMFNAAFFGGYDIPDHKPHSQYISRYPPGREATLSYPAVDLKVRNDSPCGLLVDTSYTATSITVTFWGCKWVEVTESTGPRTNFRGPETVYRPAEPDEGIAPGEERVVQTGSGEGFDITVTRTRTFPDGRTDQQQFNTSYVARPEVIARG